ncbi:TIR domain-containing protein [Edaphobacillus lindanitolerans]|uniref:Predicted nucleotide-binding protein containing TIR-like domain-containing protein n=1 Tax=Edaphobacillus lindanitolerans TaxID=550447 RepID=A0A1U7PKT9_9BACI|nr:nucleotide-binding protein [Edaphobacillus lindanitolerans]SIT72871.1 Predicted nucleotide-binding protein containing TIR-like domain-containing protein [Edaphobacillus lindanitolerans]
MENRMPRVFIGSSREAQVYVDAIHEQLNYVAEVTPWTAGVFGANRYTLEDLDQQLNSNDFAVFVFAPDDLVISRGEESYRARDNTVFEMGMFWGKLKRERVFFLVPNKAPNNFTIPSDFNGLGRLEYEVRDDQNYEAAVNRACSAIKRRIEDLNLFQDPIDLLEEMEKDLTAMRKIRLFYKRFTKLIMRRQTRPHDCLFEAIRDSHTCPADYDVTGVGIWTATDEGIQYLSGDVGIGRFYPFSINQSKGGMDKILVVESYLTSKEQVVELQNSVIRSYLMCYPIRSHVISVHMEGRANLSPEELRKMLDANCMLIGCVKDLLGEMSNE